MDEKGSEAVEKGSHALGRQIGKTAGAFKEFLVRIQEGGGDPGQEGVCGSAASAKILRCQGWRCVRQAGKEGIVRIRSAGAAAVQLGRAGGMFSAFASEFKKAAGSDAGSKSSSKTGAKKKPSTGK